MELLNESVRLDLSKQLGHEVKIKDTKLWQYLGKIFNF